MREYSGRETLWHTTLKQLAQAHLRLVKTAFWFILIVLPVYATALAAINGYILKDSNRQDNIEIGCTAMVLVYVIWHVRMTFASRGLATLLYPQLRNHITALSFLPCFNFLVYFLLWRSSLLQMRSRGVQVGIFGIDPSKVD